MNEIEKKCAQIGVPMPDFCMKLDWQNPTNFFLCINFYREYCYHTEKEIEILSNFYGEGYVRIICRAPQFHEIAQHFEKNEYDFKFLLYSENKKLTLFERDYPVSIKYVRNGNLAQACAEIYIGYYRL